MKPRISKADLIRQANALHDLVQYALALTWLVVGTALTSWLAGWW